MKKIFLKYNNSVQKIKNLIEKDNIAAIGNFDGIHFGHQKLINETKKEANKRNLAFSIITFNPHPRDYFLKSSNNFKITDELEKQRLINVFDPDYYINIFFDDNIRKLEPRAFIKNILKNKLSVKVLFAGQNFKFGKDRLGSLSESYLDFKKFDIEPKVCELVHHNQNVVSSELIRKNIYLGNFNEIKNLLGRKWSVTGKVEHGDKNGSEIGFPTANISLTEIIHPKFGVYVTNTFIMSDKGEKILSKSLPSITNFGIRPTTNDKKIIFETHILNSNLNETNLNLYDKRIYVEIVSFLRTELKFNSFSDLKHQIKKDITEAEFIHKKNI